MVTISSTADSTLRGSSAKNAVLCQLPGVTLFHGAVQTSVGSCLLSTSKESSWFLETTGTTLRVQITSYGTGTLKGPECQRIPLAFRHVLRLMNHELPNDNHHSYIIKERF